MLEAAEDFMKAPPGMMSAVREEDLKHEKKQFTKTPVAKVKAGQLCYAVFAVDKTNWGYLGKVEDIADEKVSIRVVDAHLVVGTDPKDERALNTFGTQKKKGEVDYVFVVNSEPVHQIIEAKAAPETALSKSEIDSALAKCTTWARSVTDESRRDVLRDVIRKFTSARADHAELTDEDLTKGVQEVLTIAIDNLQAEQEDGAESPSIAMGQAPANFAVVRHALAELSAKRANGAPPAAGGVSDLRHELTDIKKMLQVLMTSKDTSQGAKPSAPIGGMVNMKEDGKCCFEAAGAALAAAAGTPVSQIGSQSEKMVDEAKKRVVMNIIEITKECSSFVVEKDASERLRLAGQMWNEVLAIPADDLMTQVLDGKQWGGYVELAAAVWHSDTEIVIVHAEGIHAKASDIEVEAGIYPANLSGLPSGAPKKRRVFVVLRGNHYHIGKVVSGGTTRVIFDKGKDADDAQANIVEFLKSQSKGPLMSLTASERAEQIEEAIAKARGPSAKVSYASKAASHNTDKPNAPKATAAGSRPRPRSTSRYASESELHKATQQSSDKTCWEYNNTGKCRFGDKCKFKHGNSRPGKQQTKEGGWQVAGSRNKRKDKLDPEHYEVLKVHSKADIHPGRWRRELSKLDPDTFELTSWISREGEWYVLHAIAEDADKLLGRLTPLRKLRWTVQTVVQDNENLKGGVCVNFMMGRVCDHASPCK